MKNVVWAVLVFLTFAGCATVPVAPAVGSRPVLLVLDLQQDYLGPEPKIPVAASQVTGVQVSAKALVLGFRAAGRPVIYLHNAFSAGDWPAFWFRHDAAIAGTPGARWAGPPQEPDLWIAKKSPNAFSEPALAAFLEAVGADSVVIAGVFADPFGGVPSTVAGALARGYPVTVAYDAVGTATEQGLEPALGALAQAGAWVVPTGTVLEKL